VEAVEAIGEGSCHAEAAYGYHWVLMGLANKLFLKAFQIAVYGGMKALNDWGLR
jgi:hypothetical protein